MYIHLSAHLMFCICSSLIIISKNSLSEVLPNRSRVRRLRDGHIPHFLRKCWKTGFKERLRFLRSCMHKIISACYNNVHVHACLLCALRKLHTCTRSFLDIMLDIMRAIYISTVNILPGLVL